MNMFQKIGRVVLWLLIGLLLLVISQTIQIGRAGWATYQDVTALRESWQGTLEPDTIAELDSQLTPLSEHLTALHQAVQPVAFLLRRCQWIPAYGPMISSLPDLTIMGHEGGLVARKLAPLVQKLVDAQDEKISLAPIGLEMLVKNRDELMVHLVPLEQAAHSVPATALPDRLSQRWPQMHKTLSLAKSALQMAPELSLILGFDQPQSYLVLMQNNHELRSTGGFITSVGEMTVAEGLPSEFDFVDSYDIFHREPPYPPLPEPMQQYMNIETLYLRDANWSPHLPTTARLARDLYFVHTGVPAAGVVTVDLHAVELLIGALEPINIEGTVEPITAQNVLSVMQSSWNQPSEITESDEWWVGRKDFIPHLVEGVMIAIDAHGITNLSLAEALLNALDRRFIQIWLDNPNAASELAKLGWDGALQPEKGADYLMLVDSNLGFNKADAVIQRSVDYVLEWSTNQDGEQRAKATTTVTYEHTLEKLGHVCDITPRYSSEGAIYEEMFERCYFAYPRLYVPAGSELISIDGIASGSAVSEKGEAHTQVFAGYFSVEPGKQHEVRFEYWLPSTITPDNYQLVIQRQAGLKSLPVTLKIGDRQEKLDVVEGMVGRDDF